MFLDFNSSVVQDYFCRNYEPNPLQFGSIRLYLLGETHCGVDNYQNPHRQNFFEITYVVKGKGKIKGKNEFFEAGQDDLFISVPGEEHDIISDPENPLWFTGIGLLIEHNPANPGDEMDTIVRRLSNSENPICNARHDIYPLIVLLFNEFLFGGDYSSRVVQSLLEQILIYVYRSFFEKVIKKSFKSGIERPDNDVVYTTMNYIDVNCLHIHSLTEVSDRMGYSYNYLSGLFSKTTGMSLHAYYLKSKMTAAGKYLRQGKSVTDVSELLGYQSVQSFSRVFKKHQMSPPSSFTTRKQKK